MPTSQMIGDLCVCLFRLWAGARAANYLGPFFNTVISSPGKG